MKKMLKNSLILVALVLFAGCHHDWNWCEDPDPTPAPTPIPSPVPFGQVISVWPSLVPGSAGSLDFKDDGFFEFCKGEAALYHRSVADGSPTGKTILDPKLKDLWAVAWDRFKGCYWGLNPDVKGYNENFIKIDVAGSRISGMLMEGGTPGNPICPYDGDINEDYTFTDPYGNKIEVGLLLVEDWHIFSGSKLMKFDYINTDEAWEQFWWKLEIEFRAGVRVGDKYWAASLAGPLYEYNQSNRKDWGTPTGRSITVPGAKFTSLKYAYGCLWGKAPGGIYRISLGQ